MFNWLDVVVVLVILVSAGLGACRGLTRELLSLTGWVGGIYVGVLWYQPLASCFRQHGLDSVLFSQVGAFLVIAILVVIIVSLISRFLSSRITDGCFCHLDRLLGAVFGGVRGLFLISLLVFLLAKTPLLADEYCKESCFLPHLTLIGNAVYAYFPKLYRLMMGILGKDVGVTGDEGVLA